MTVFEGDKHLRLRVEGEVWVCNDNYAPVRITLVANQLVSVLDLIGAHVQMSCSLLLNCCSPEKRF